KTFRTSSSRMTGCPLELMNPPASLQSHAIVRIPGAHVREHDTVSRLQAFQDLDRRHRALAETHLDARRFVAVAVDPEERHLALFLAERGPAHVDDVGETVELDRSVHREIGPRTLRQRT